MTSSQNSTCGPNAFYWTEAWPVTLQTDLVWRWWLPSAVLPPGPTKSRRPSSETQLSLLQRPNTCCCIWVPSESSQLLGNLKIILYWQRLGFSSSELEETLKRKKKQKNNALQVRTVTRGKYNTGQSPVDIHQFSELEVCYHFSLFMKCLQWETIQIWWRELEQVRKLI